ncbi:hypothetical protein [Abyssibius alkaniclasticus]|uniref:hypothetical protein n=1 Tax=Abyssibius alkaniclasticus TaxID=2881234 RepID=UPI004058BF1C|tara:strand:+ start:427 stop:648 length:222 start_codon:yes stop_codon:yes gene_type:complete
MLSDFATTLLGFWSDFSTACQLWIGSAVYDMTGYVSSNILNGVIFYGFVGATLLALRAYVLQFRKVERRIKHS